MVRHEGAQVFVKIDEYQDILDTVNVVKNKINEAKDVLSKINDLKNKEDAELDLWHAELDEVSRKVTFIDKELFEPEAL